MLSPVSVRPKRKSRGAGWRWVLLALTPAFTGCAALMASGGGEIRVEYDESGNIVARQGSADAMLAMEALKAEQKAAEARQAAIVGMNCAGLTANAEIACAASQGAAAAVLASQPPSSPGLNAYAKIRGAEEQRKAQVISVAGQLLASVPQWYIAFKGVRGGGGGDKITFGDIHGSSMAGSGGNLEGVSPELAGLPGSTGAGGTAGPGVVLSFGTRGSTVGGYAGEGIQIGENIVPGSFASDKGIVGDGDLNDADVTTSTIDTL